MPLDPRHAQAMREQHIDAALENLWPAAPKRAREALERLYDQALANPSASTRAVRHARAA